MIPRMLRRLDDTPDQCLDKEGRDEKEPGILPPICWRQRDILLSLPVTLLITLRELDSLSFHVPMSVWSVSSYPRNRGAV